MNNGRPPYGDPSQWGQQPTAGQDPAAQFVPGQYPQQGAYQPPAQSQPYPTYQPQNRQPQESYQQQSWQPYGQQAAQQPYQQSVPQGYPQQGYQQPMPQGYPQQGYQQSYQQPLQQGYPQQSYQQQGQPMYQQSVQNGQPLQQGQPQGGPAPGQFVSDNQFSGYVTHPDNEAQPNPFTPEVIMKVVLFGLLPVLFFLGVLLKSPVLCGVFLAAAAGSVGFMWLREVVDGNLRLVSSMIIGAASVVAVVALVMSLGGSGKQQQTTGNAGTTTNSAQTGAQGTGVLTWENTPTPSPSPTADPFAESGAASEVLQSFFYFWHVNNDESMLALTAPSWRNAQPDPLKALFTIRANRTPADDVTILSISGDEADSVRTAKVTVTISRNITGRTPDVLAFDVMLRKEDGQWYIDPQSLTSNEVVSTAKPTNEMATQPVLHTGKPDTVLYYNTDGGSYYHIDQYCGRIDARYLPLRGQFLYSQLDDAPYSSLEQCKYCGAPLRGQ